MTWSKNCSALIILSLKFFSPSWNVTIVETSKADLFLFSAPKTFIFLCWLISWGWRAAATRELKIEPCISFLDSQIDRNIASARKRARRKSTYRHHICCYFVRVNIVVQVALLCCSIIVMRLDHTSIKKSTSARKMIIVVRSEKFRMTSKDNSYYMRSISFLKWFWILFRIIFKRKRGPFLVFFTTRNSGRE